MNNTIRAVLVIITILIGNYFICRNIENAKLKKQIKMLCSLLIVWMVIRIIKYQIKNYNIKKILWYLYYFPILFSSVIFLNIGIWHNRNKKYIKILKIISLVMSSIIFLCVITNDLHRCVFKIDVNSPDLEKEYTYGIVYYLCLAYVVVNIVISIISSIRYSTGFYRKQKFSVMLTIFVFIFLYAVGFIGRIPFIFHSDFSSIYCLCYMLALMIIVYKEKYRLLIEENLYSEIEDAIKDKTILIKKIINDISNSKNQKRDLAYIKLLISYCKNKSNLIILQKSKDYYTWEELKLFVDNALKDASSLGINGAVNVINKFEIPIYTLSFIYDYIYFLFEYAHEYTNTNMLISIQKILNSININVIINTNEKIIPFEYSCNMNVFIKSGKILVNQLKEENSLKISLKIPNDLIIVKEVDLTEKERHALLEIKSKIHDILGQRLSVISKIIDEGMEEDNIIEIKPLLKNILNDVDNKKLINPKDLLRQIVYTCEMAGTKLYIVGELPQNYIKAITLVQIIRECSTNAIRHA